MMSEHQKESESPTSPLAEASFFNLEVAQAVRELEDILIGLGQLTPSDRMEIPPGLEVGTGGRSNEQ